MMDDIEPYKPEHTPPYVTAEPVPVIHDDETLIIQPLDRISVLEIRVNALWDKFMDKPIDLSE